MSAATHALAAVIGLKLLFKDVECPHALGRAGGNHTCGGGEQRQGIEAALAPAAPLGPNEP